MKKLIVLLVCVLISVPFTALASDPGFNGLCATLLKEEVKAPEHVLSTEEANTITYELLGDTPFADGKTYNCDLVKYLASKLQVNTEAGLMYKDMGLIPKEYRKYYTTLEFYGKLYSSEGYLLPQKEVTYEFLINSLVGFKADIITNNGLTMYEGTVTDVYLEDKATNISLSTATRTETIRSKNISTVGVFKDGKFAPYSRNILRGDTMRIYTTASRELIYAEETFANDKKNAYINPKYTLYKADVYYLEGNMLITRNVNCYKDGTYTPVDARYFEFNITPRTYIKENFLNVSEIHINRRLLDKTAYIICDSNNNALYINVCK